MNVNYTELRKEAVDMILKIDDELANLKPFVDTFAGKTREELGDGLFEKVMYAVDSTRRLMCLRLYLLHEVYKMNALECIKKYEES